MGAVSICWGTSPDPGACQLESRVGELSGGVWVTQMKCVFTHVNHFVVVSAIFCTGMGLVCVTVHICMSGCMCMRICGEQSLTLGISIQMLPVWSWRQYLT